MLRSSWEDINDTRRRSYAGNQSYKLDPRNDFVNPSPLSPAEEQNVRIGRQEGKGKGEGKEWQYSSSSSNHISNTARGVRVSEESRGGVTLENQPKV